MPCVAARLRVTKLKLNDDVPDSLFAIDASSGEDMRKKP